ncbi:hypothetical protein H5410_060872 [Solanum commersonii]|uniref:C2H2-type domain-containing protein n=1 Tax=Solanum commersonii TaxID=4109 RepID=A0A9J5W6F0_SOLCO|nr:hypothetical protein H5410_060872 [Solanum commersonii]
MDRQQMERRNIIESSNEAIVDCTTPLINQLNVPISSNADELTFSYPIFCPVCYGIFHTYSEFINHIQITHPLSFERNIILHLFVYASSTFFTRKSSINSIRGPTKC